MLKNWQRLTSRQEWLELDSFWRSIQQPWWTSYFSQMKRSSPLLPLPTHRTTVRVPEKKDVDEKRLVQRDWPFASQSRCRSASRSSAALLSTLSSRESKWMQNTIATTCLDRSYCQTCASHPRMSFFVFQQDGAPAHRACDTITFLERQTPDFIPPTLWPPNLPDLNPVDYSIWSVLQEKVYRSKITDVDELKTRLIDEWAQFCLLYTSPSPRD